GGALDLAGVSLVVRVVRAHRDLVGPDELRLLDENVLGQVDVDGTRPSRLRDVERLADDGTKVLAILDEEVVLRRRARNPDVIGFLEGVVADEVRRDLS